MPCGRAWPPTGRRSLQARSSGAGRWSDWRPRFGELALVLVEPDGQGVDLLLELREPAGQAVALVAEGLGEGNHRFDQSLLTRLGRGGVTQRRHVVHRGSSLKGSRRSEQFECRSWAR